MFCGTFLPCHSIEDDHETHNQQNSKDSLSCASAVLFVS